MLRVEGLGRRYSSSVVYTYVIIGKSDDVPLGSEKCEIHRLDIDIALLSTTKTPRLVLLLDAFSGNRIYITHL